MSQDPRVVIEGEPNRRRPTTGARETSKVAARETALSWARAGRTGLGRWALMARLPPTVVMLSDG
jgi:hypothetical protein